MNTPLITWSLIVGLVIIILLSRLLRARSLRFNKRNRLISFLSEREEFYMPGDPNPTTTDEYDYEDLGDL